eukprot:TRINITY_DN71293_c0_g1_i1.p1 TRINITY_DN71293_c0_g1~~TRINITY_DN71293_c0_g1_i1.p1  ORF type:complete len:1008 (+),score=97.26 TRINITY_DN71293_c0_g1_i1:85-3108(+)
MAHPTHVRTSQPPPTRFPVRSPSPSVVAGSTRQTPPARFPVRSSSSIHLRSARVPASVASARPGRLSPVPPTSPTSATRSTQKLPSPHPASVLPSGAPPASPQPATRSAQRLSSPLKSSSLPSGVPPASPQPAVRSAQRLSTPLKSSGVPPASPQPTTRSAQNLSNPSSLASTLSSVIAANSNSRSTLRVASACAGPSSSPGSKPAASPSQQHAPFSRAGAWPTSGPAPTQAAASAARTTARSAAKSSARSSPSSLASPASVKATPLGPAPTRKPILRSGAGQERLTAGRLLGSLRSVKATKVPVQSGRATQDVQAKCLAQTLHTSSDSAIDPRSLDVALACASEDKFGSMECAKVSLDVDGSANMAPFSPLDLSSEVDDQDVGQANSDAPLALKEIDCEFTDNIIGHTDDTDLGANVNGTDCVHPETPAKNNQCTLNETPEKCVQPAEAQGSVAPEVCVEGWQEYLTRTGTRIKSAGLSLEPSALWDAFRSTEDVDMICATFAQLFRSAPEPPWEMSPDGAKARYPYEDLRTLLGENWKAKQLWKVLDARAGRSEYDARPCASGRLSGRRCVVVGAGPCGLRAAIELRLLGARVTVVEQRCRFSRINQLHIWSWAGEDIKGLGARIIEPPPLNFGANPDLLHITINDLQKFLLKVALLFGAEVLFGTDYLKTEWDATNWRSIVQPTCMSSNAKTSVAAGRAGGFESQASLRFDDPPSHKVRGSLSDVAVVVGSGGFSSGIADEVGIKMLEGEHTGAAIGLIVNFARSNGPCQGRLRSWSLARQFYMQLFKRLASEIGVELENIVYVKSHISHYFVMTPTPKSLHAMGVLRDLACVPLLGRANIDIARLDVLVRQITNFPFKEDEMPVLESITCDLGGQPPGYADNGPQLFDFSTTRRCQEGLKFLHPLSAEVQNTENNDSLLTILVGDALMEPFWPEGLGIIRGFFGVLDACSAVKQWAEGASESDTRLHHDVAFQKLKTLSAATRSRTLHDKEEKYALAPETRYR